MWVVLRLLTALVVGLLRYFWRWRASGEARVTNGIAWRFVESKHKGRVIGTAFGVEYQNPVFFRLTPEGGIDRFFKSIGFTREIQTGDPALDAAVYIACDHPALEPVLQGDAIARGAIKSLCNQEAKRLQTDGAHLWVHFPGKREPTEATLADLAGVRDALAAIPAEHLVMLRDRFFWRALLVEAIAWSIAFYGLPAIAELATRPHPLYFTLTPLIATGLTVAAAMFALLFGLAWWLLRGSSRSHRVLTESTFLLIIGVPLSSIQLVSDLNVSLDHSTAVPVTQTVADKYTRITRSKKRTTTHYHLRFAPPGPESFPVPADVEVSRGIYNSVNQGGRMVIRMRAGAIKIPWVEAMHPTR